MLAAQSIQLGINDVVVAGGMESMSNAPKYLAEARLIRLSHSWFSSFCIQVVISDSVLACRKGSRLGHDTLVDGMMKDGLWDVYNDCGMGSCAELCAEKHVITREDQVLCSLRGSFDETLSCWARNLDLYLHYFCRITFLFRALSVVLLPNRLELLHGKLFRLDIFLILCLCVVIYTTIYN